MLACATPSLLLATLYHLAWAARAAGDDFDCASNGTQTQPSTCSMDCLESCWSEFTDSPCIEDCWEDHGLTFLVAVFIPVAGRLMVDWLFNEVKAKTLECAGRLWRND